MKNLFSSLKEICKSGAKDQSLMLIVTSAVGWALSSAAQIAGIVCNDKISKKEKNFLIPQEFCDGVVNVATFLGITLLAKNGVSKMIQNKKITFPNHDVAQYASPLLTTVSIITGAFASNIVTPIVRNYLGACFQKKYNKIQTQNLNKPNSNGGDITTNHFNTPAPKANTYYLNNNFLYPTTMMTKIR